MSAEPPASRRAGGSTPGSERTRRPTSVVGILGDLPLTAGVLLPFLGWELGPPTEIAAAVASWEP